VTLPGSTDARISLISPLPGGVSLVPDLAVLVRNYDWAAGLRPNHNQTLVRDATRKARSR
jgi:hypothetical protein